MTNKISYGQVRAMIGSIEYKLDDDLTQEQISKVYKLLSKAFSDICELIDPKEAR